MPRSGGNIRCQTHAKQRLGSFDSSGENGIARCNFENGRFRNRDGSPCDIIRICGYGARKPHRQRKNRPVHPLPPRWLLETISQRLVLPSDDWPRKPQTFRNRNDHFGEIVLPNVNFQPAAQVLKLRDIAVLGVVQNRVSMWGTFFTCHCSSTVSAGSTMVERVYGILDIWAEFRV